MLFQRGMVSLNFAKHIKEYYNIMWKNKQTNKHTHITQKVKIYSEMQEIQNHIYNS